MRLPRRPARARLVIAAALALPACAGRPDPLANLEPARLTLAAYLEAWRTLDFRTMHSLTNAATLGGLTADQYELASNQTLLENALIASHMRYEVGTARADTTTAGAAIVDLAWTLPDMARAVREATELTRAGVDSRALLDRLAPLVGATIPLVPHTLAVRLVWEDGRWKVDPTTMKVTSTHVETAPAP